MTRGAALPRRGISEEWRNSARLGSKLFVASRVFEWLVLRILKMARRAEIHVFSVLGE